MRADAFGLLWEEQPKPERVRGERAPRERVMPPIPDTGWTMPAAPPNIPPRVPMAVDCETIDNGLSRGIGPGGVHGDGKIVGVAVAVDGAAWYFPTAHDLGVNCSWDVHAWLRDTVPRASLVVGHNLLYDLEWLRAECVDIADAVPLYDTQFAAALLDENAQSYSLDSLATAAFGEGKLGDELYTWLARWLGGEPTRKGQGASIGRAPPVLVGPYAEQDAALTLRLYQHQRPQLLAQVKDIAALEFGLLPLLLEMRFQGVRVDEQRAAEARQRMVDERDRAIAELSAMSSRAVDIWTSDSAGEALARCGVDVPRTAGGAYSLRQAWLKQQKHPAADLLVRARERDKLIGTFLDGYILNAARAGRVHAQFHPLKSDDGGTVSGRFSSSGPNLQNIPARNEYARRALRGAFIPEDGHEWHALDYSQIEYRLLAHHAVGAGADIIRARYNADPSTNYHKATTALIHEKTGLLIDHTHTKNVNFGLAYGMGQTALADFLGLPHEEAQNLFAAYHEALPFVRETYDAADRNARRHGFVRTFAGRVCRFPFFENRNGELVREHRPGYRRAGTHKALNRILQGGAADIMKYAMLAIWREFRRSLVPLVTVHDELGFSRPADDPDIRRVEALMVQCVRLSVPLRVASTHGATWGDCK